MSTDERDIPTSYCITSTVTQILNREENIVLQIRSGLHFPARTDHPALPVVGLHFFLFDNSAFNARKLEESASIKDERN